jgi:methionyl-tRNA synthetase
VETYNANLANGLGNLTSRILKMAISNDISLISPITTYQSNQLLVKFEFQKVVDQIWQKIKVCDEYIQKTEPFKIIKTDKNKAEKDIKYLLSELYNIALSLQPFLPQTSEKILQVLKEPKLENILKLFPRIE